MDGYGVVSFATDYGLTDGFVAACHGVIARIAPEVRVIDVTHQIPRGDVRRGALVLAQTLPYFPPCVHVAVVDPGVGTRRRAVAIAVPAAILVGPDNGLLPWAADALGGPQQVVEVTNEEMFVHPVRRTFHGRDIFAPVAAHLATGRHLTEVGPPIDVASLVRLPDPGLEIGPGWVTAEVLTVDHFGNIQLAAGTVELATLGAANDVVDIAGVPAVLGQTFGSAGPAELVVYVDSSDRAAIAVNGGNAAERLGVSPGDVVRLATVPPAQRDPQAQL